MFRRIWARRSSKKLSSSRKRFLKRRLSLRSPLSSPALLLISSMKRGRRRRILMSLMGFLKPRASLMAGKWVFNKFQKKNSIFLLRSSEELGAKRGFFFLAGRDPGGGWEGSGCLHVREGWPNAYFSWSHHKQDQGEGCHGLFWLVCIDFNLVFFVSLLNIYQFSVSLSVYLLFHSYEFMKHCK